MKVVPCPPSETDLLELLNDQPIEETRERNRFYKAVGNAKKLRIQRETKQIISGFYADPRNWLVIHIAKTRDGGVCGRGDMDSQLWSAIFSAFFGRPPNGIYDPKWDDLLSKDRRAITAVREEQARFWECRRWSLELLT